MSNTVIFLTIGAAIVVGIIAIGIHRLRYKKSIVFSITATMVTPILLACIVGFIVGIKGPIHFLWAAPLVLVVNTTCYNFIAKMIQRPLGEMMKTVDSLSEGDVEVNLDEKFQKGEHELAQVMRQLAILTGSLKNISAFANHIGKGDLNVEYTLLGKKDSLGRSMLDMRANLIKAEVEKEERQCEDERRNWVTHGIAKFSELLRANNNNIAELCHLIVSNLVKYIGANQAGIFILNDEDAENPVLELKACYAYERRKYINKTIGLGEGLVGTCFLEGESIYMTCLPKDYINITSGLGGDTPRALLLVPLKVNEKIYGIVEIAAFKEFEPHIREFVEKVSESIASTIGSVKVSIHTNKLLERTKIQAEEMANQEEELRQNMEEMQATQEEMFRREAELKDALEKMKAVQTVGEEKEYEMNLIQELLFASLNVIEFSADGIITDVTQNLAKLFNIDKSAVIGKSMATFIGDESYNKALSSLVQGKIFEDVLHVKAGETALSVRHTFLPISNRQGELLRVLLLAFPENS